MNRFDSHRDKPVSTRRSQAGDPAAVPLHHLRPDNIVCGSLTLPLGRSPHIMGVLNVTPDSFSDGGQYFEPGAAVARALALQKAGAHIIDVGGESTRPGAQPVSAGEELDRVFPVIDALAKLAEQGEAQTAISIDTRKAEVADVALRRGCHIINDVSAASDPEMVGVLRDHPRVPIVLMHTKGDPATMQTAPYYDDVVGEVSTFLSTRAEELVGAGIAKGQIIVDPGIGFGKRFRDNLELLNRVDSFLSLGYPVLIGASRKRFLGELLGADTGDRLPGGLAVAAHCFHSGVDVVRVHDVAETAGLLRVLDAMAHPEHYEADW